MRIEFIVKDIPPKKHGEKSMWARRDEAFRVVSLRQEAIKARSKAGLSKPIDSLVAIELQIFVPKSELKRIGDLDNFITGICDGLQAADPKVLPHIYETLKDELKGEACPEYELLMVNDSQVASIMAKKIAIEENQQVYYRVVIEPLN